MTRSRISSPDTAQDAWPTERRSRAPGTWTHWRHLLGRVVHAASLGARLPVVPELLAIQPLPKLSGISSFLSVETLVSRKSNAKTFRKHAVVIQCFAAT